MSRALPFVAILLGNVSVQSARIQAPKPMRSAGRSTATFRNHVLPVLTKAGCNSGACHGATSGKGGMKLTLRGFDPLTDYFTLTRQALARRVDAVVPDKSLMLLKPSGAIPHGGGVRFATSSLEYRIIRDWIAEGARPPREDDPAVSRLEVLPASAVLQVGGTQPVRVRAHYSHGRIEDVTRWAKFSSNDSSVATVDDDGNVKATGSGEVAVTVWFSSKVAFATITIPYGTEDG